MTDLNLIALALGDLTMRLPGAVNKHSRRTVMLLAAAVLVQLSRGLVAFADEPQRANSVQQELIDELLGEISTHCWPNV